MKVLIPILIGLLVVGCGKASAAEIPSGKSGFESHIKPFFKTYCVKCHGPDKSKGKVTLHDLDGDLATGKNLLSDENTDTTYFNYALWCLCCYGYTGRQGCWNLCIG